MKYSKLHLFLMVLCASLIGADARAFSLTDLLDLIQGGDSPEQTQAEEGKPAESPAAAASSPSVSDDDDFFAPVQKTNEVRAVQPTGHGSNGPGPASPTAAVTPTVPLPVPRPAYTPPPAPKREIVETGRLKPNFTLQDTAGRTIPAGQTVFGATKPPVVHFRGSSGKDAYFSVNGKTGKTPIDQAFDFGGYGVYADQDVLRDPREGATRISRTRKDPNAPKATFLYTGTVNGDWYQVLVSDLTKRDPKTGALTSELGWVHADGVPPEVQSKIAANPKEMKSVAAEEEASCVGTRGELERNSKITAALEARGVAPAHIFSSWRGKGLLAGGAVISINNNGTYTLSNNGKVQQTGQGRICIEEGDNVFLFANAGGKDTQIPLTSPNELSAMGFTFERDPTTTQGAVK